MSIAKPMRASAAVALMMVGIVPASALNLPFGLGGAAKHPPSQVVEQREPPVQMAQMADSGQRIGQLEEENRRLNGKVEELSFQVLQMQEQMRKMQEDNEFRFQEIEGGGGAKPASSGGQKRSEAAPSQTPDSAGASAPVNEAASAAPSSSRQSGDQIGDLLGEGGLDTAKTGATPPAGKLPKAGSNTVASIKTGSEGELYGLAYNYLLAGDYQLAENSFRQYTQTYPDAKDVPDARYWLGESLFQQAKFADAAETFLNAQKDYPKSAKAPEMMLKLGMSLAKLDNRDTACVTFKEVSRRYPQMSATVKRKLTSESQAAKC